MKAQIRRPIVLGIIGALLSLAGTCEGDRFVSLPDDESACGKVGNPCCDGLERCEPGAACTPDGAGQCCAVPFGAACEETSDCCGSLSCTNQRCCSPPGASCDNAHECCEGMLCNAGRCQPAPAGCGRKNQSCCSGNACTSGTTCSGDRCTGCGGPGQPCCSPGVCFQGLSCGPNGTCERGFSCGGLGEYCCAEGTGFSASVGNKGCGDGLRCTAAGRCRLPGDDCDHTSCDRCRQEARCGWCASSRTCLPGTEGGPSAGQCDSASWLWNPFECRDESNSYCENLATLNQCVRSPGCGWCGNCLGGACMAGSPNGPTSGSCGFWQTNPNACDEYTCKEAGNECASSVECCGLLSCKTKYDEVKRCCVEASQNCNGPSDCCGSLRCEGGQCVCLAEGEYCTYARDCCSNHCNSQGQCGRIE